MAYKNTIAIIGATTTSGAAIAKSISKNYRLLLMDVSLAQVEVLQSEIVEENADSEIEVLSCCKDASWEADIVVVVVDEEKLVEVASKIKEVTTCKPVIQFVGTDGNINQLQQLLPHAKVVAVVTEQSITDITFQNAFIHGEDEAAVEAAKELMIAIGCKP